MSYATIERPGGNVAVLRMSREERLNALGVSSTTYPYPQGRDFSTPEDIKRLCKALNRTGKLLRKEGIDFSYHNHNMELHKVGGKTVLEWK